MTAASSPVASRILDGLPAPQRYLAVGVLLTALILVVLDGAIANIALPSITRTFHAAASDTVWVVSSYQLAVLVALLPCGALGEKFGARRVFLGGIAVFTVASIPCAMAGNLPMLVCARFVQGVGGGAVMALGTMILRFAVPQRLLGTIIGVNAMTIAISSAAGPGLAGAILSFAPWPWLFAVNLPIGAAVLVGGALLPHLQGSARRLDIAAVAVNTLMFVMFFCGADRLATAPWTGVALIAAAIACLIALLRLERGRATPLVPVDLFRDKAFSVAAIASVCCFTGQMMSYVALPFYLQHNLHLTPTQAGLYMMPWPAAVVVMAPLSGRLANKVPTAWLCAAGGALLAAGLAIVAVFPAGGTVFITGTVIAGLGFGLFQTPNNRTLLLSAPRARSGAAGAMQGTSRLTGQTLGAILASILFGLAPLDHASGLALGLAAVAAGLAGVISAGRARYEIKPADSRQA